MSSREHPLTNTTPVPQAWAWTIINISQEKKLRLRGANSTGERSGRMFLAVWVVTARTGKPQMFDGTVDLYSAVDSR